jgi:hypothetical protein
MKLVRVQDTPPLVRLRERVQVIIEKPGVQTRVQL